MFIDVHCHVYDGKIEELAERMREKNIIAINSGADFGANRKTLKLADRFPEFKATMGLYPLDALKMSEKKFEDEINFIRENKGSIVAISEVGMDFKEDEKNHEIQRRNFKRFIELAKELDKPLIVHSRKAEKECIELLEKLKAKKVVMHCFSGDFSLVRRIRYNSWFLSIPSCVKNSQHFQKIIQEVPIENLLCETDSPYLHPDKKFPNEPTNILVSYEFIAKIKNISLKEVEEKIEDNCRKLFGI